MTEEKPFDPKRHLELFLKFRNKFADAIGGYVVGLVDRRRGRLRGTGTLIRCPRGSYIFTAGYVVQAVETLLNDGDLSLATQTSSGAITLRARSESVCQFEPHGPTFADAGVIRLDPDVAAAIPAWTLNQFLVAPHRPRRLDEVGRVFITTGFPEEMTTTMGNHYLRANLLVLGWSRHETIEIPGAICLGCNRASFVDLDGGTFRIDNLAGLSGAPVWTLDGDDEIHIDVNWVGVHSGSTKCSATAGDEHAVVAPLASLRKLVTDKGWEEVGWEGEP